MVSEKVKITEPPSTENAQRPGQRNWNRERGRFQLLVFLIIVIAHIGTLVAPWHYTGEAAFLALGVWVLAMGPGISVCFHRLLTHRSFETYPSVRLFLTILGTLALQGSPTVWVGTHRLHHRYADKDGDPHSPRDGFWWGHAMWAMFFEHLDAREHAKDVVDDSWMRAIDTIWFLPSVLLGLLLWYIAGWPGVLWGMCVRTVVGYHATWLVNSVSHTWGYRSHETRDDSRNNPIVAVLSFGEGWHNNHHAFPQSARHGRKPVEIDLGYIFIRLLGWLRLAWGIRTA